MRVVITGADGFVGRWLCRAFLADGAWVAGWIRQFGSNPIPGVHYRIQDVRDQQGCERAMAEDQPQQVVHLAAVTHLESADREPTTAHDTNVRGTHNVFAAMPRTAAGVHASTCHVYGRPQDLPITESHPLNPIGVYSTTKAESESAARAACAEVVVARAFHHTGAGQSPRFALAGWAQQLAEGMEPIIVGNLALRRDYTDVRDICAGYQVLADRGVPGETYNLCSGEAPTLEDLLAGLNLGSPPSVELDPSRIRDNDIQEFRGDPARALALGWRPTVTRTQMLADLRRSF